MTEPAIINDPEWDRLAEQGITSEYVSLSGPPHTRLCKPIFTLEWALANGYMPKGTKARWVDANGYNYERDRAREHIGTDRILTVKECNIGSSSSKYKFDEIDGWWNTVMFEKVEY